MVAEMLSLPAVNSVKSLTIENGTATLDREIEGGKEVVTCPLPCVVSATEGMAEPRIPNMRGIMSARTKPLTVAEPVDVENMQQIVSYDKPQPRTQVKLIDAANVAALVDALHNEAKVI